MTTATLTPNPKFQGFASNGDPLSGGKLYTYATGTSTPLSTYPTKADAEAGTNANQNPVVLDSRGEANVWLLGTQLYRFTLTTSADAAVWGPIDGIGSTLVSSLSGANGSSMIGFIQEGSGAVARTAQAKMREAKSITDFGALGDGTTDDTAAVTAATLLGIPMYVPYTANYYKVTALTAAHQALLWGPGTVKLNGAAVQIASMPLRMLLAGSGAYANNRHLTPPWNYYGLLDFIGYREQPGVYGAIPNVVAATIPTTPDGTLPGLAAWCPTNNCIYTVNATTNNVSVINATTNVVTGTVATGTYPVGICYCPFNNSVYVLNYNAASITVIDCASNTATATIAVGLQPQVITYCPANNCMYVVLYGPIPSEVSIIDCVTNSITKTMQVGGAASGIAYVPRLNKIYITNQNDNNLSVLDVATNTITGTIALVGASGPGALQYVPTNDCLYTVNYNPAANSVNVYNLTSAAHSTVAVGGNPYDVCYCPKNNYLYVANQSTNNVTILDCAGNTVIATLAVGNGPSGSAWCASNNCIYVCNGSSDSVSVIQCGIHITTDRFKSFGAMDCSAAGQFFTSNGASTAAQYLTIANTGGNFRFGLESSAGNQLATGAVAYSAVLTTAGATWLHLGTNGVTAVDIDPSGNVTPHGNGTQSFGDTAHRWLHVWCTDGAFNGSDARMKTGVTALSEAESNAAQKLADAVGTYQWLEAIEKKGKDGARLHVGLTVQQAIQIMTDSGLDWTRYGFIAYDKWDDEFIEHPEQPSRPAFFTELGRYVPPQESKAAWTEHRTKAGEGFAFRYDELNIFISRGQQLKLRAIEERLAAIEAKQNT